MALQGVQMPSIAGVYGVKDFREDLRPDGGLGKLANMAMNLYQFKSNQAQQKEMQDAAQKFNAEQSELQRNWQQNQKKEDQAFQRNLQEAKWAQDKAIMDRQEALQNKKELAGFQAEANPIITMVIDERNRDAVMSKANRLQQVISNAKKIGDIDTMANATEEYNRLMGMYTKDSGGKRTGGVLQDIEEQEAAQEEAEKAAAKKQSAMNRWKSLNDAGAVDAAWNYMYENSQLFSPEDVAQMQSLMAAKDSELRGKRQSEISRDQNFNEDQKKKSRRGRWK